ncbi:potassium-transporting ATPase subunit beta [Spea bombifrons]|uniref:potassium-transporting ATPase subunit beta n=1 Tax=Spea bombifrons TaxID=233779 RepID=UPI002349090B|nr:potassium-transporting ATPase subunit beta [Spea bombifrons]
MATFNEKKTCSERMENFGRFVWNPDTGELMGRTLIKWVYISLYYVAFYIVMIGIFALSIYSLMKTLSPYHPDYQDRLKSPGVTVRPNSHGDDGFQIFYNMTDNTSYNLTVSNLCQFLSVYKAETQEKMNKNCSNNTDIGKLLNAKGLPKYACQFTTDMLGNCSYKNDPTFGYASGQPCVFIKINRIINFVPGNDTAPYVNCTSEEGGLGQVEYYPPGGTFGLQYFPYYGKKAQPNYTNPLVAVKFLNVQKNKELDVVCTVVGQGIITDNPHDPYEGKVSFKLKIES